MKPLALVGIFLTCLISASVAPAQQQRMNVPKLADLMVSIQLRHIKLWFAGTNQNWDLAGYEVGQIKGSLEDAADLYLDIPVRFVTDTSTPVHAIQEAIEAKDPTKFAKGFKDLTASCNACHQAIGRGFIAIQVPTASPFSDQSFTPKN
jgi:hypothetical protein